MGREMRREPKGSWWTTTRLFVFITSLVLLLSFIIVFLITPPASRQGFWVEVLLAVAGAALVVLLVNIADRLIFIKDVSSRVENVMTTVLDQRMTDSHWSTGIVGIHGSLSEAGFGEMIAEAVNQEICILDTYIPDALFITSKMGVALSQGCNFKFLVLDPNSEQARARSKVLAWQGLDYTQFSYGTMIYICNIASVAHEANLPGRIQMRLYSEPPGVPLYMFRDHESGGHHQRDRLLFGFFLDKASYVTRHLEVGRVGQQLFEMLEEHFDRMWERNAEGEIDLSSYLKDSCPVGFAQTTRTS